MLESIHIENIALIKTLDIPFSPGFSAFTGETGAGKSIIVDAIGLLCGDKAPKELIRAGEQTAFVEALFRDLTPQSIARLDALGVQTDDDGYLTVSRTLGTDGKSVCRVNSRHVSASLLREMSAFLINIHGQHDNQDLLKKEKHLGILDSFALAASEKAAYDVCYKEYTDIKREYAALTTDEAEKQRLIEMLKYQISDISALKLKSGEDEALRAEKKRLSNIEKIAENASNVHGLLFDGQNSAVESIDSAMSCLNQLAKLTDGCDEYIDRLEKARSEIYDIAECVYDMAGDTDGDPSARLDRIEQRLYDIDKLRRKYGPTVDDILLYLENAKKRLSDLELADERLASLEKQLSDVKARVKKTADALTSARKAKAKVLGKAIEEQLAFLDMGKVKFDTSFVAKDYAADGADDIEFLVMANTGGEFMPLHKTASGGELSRIMLAIKSVLSEKDGVETQIFDEVDTGISGRTSRRIGIRLADTASHSQVMCVTHSAQIASLADTHFKVSKAEKGGKTVTSVEALDGDARVDETARIISGMNITDAARKTAEELICGKAADFEK